MDKKKILIVGAPSGGHLFPAQSFVETFQQEAPETIFHLMSSNRAEKFKKYIPENLFERYLFFEDLGIYSGDFLKTLKSFLLFPIVFFRILHLIRKESYDLVMGFGGALSFFAVYGASLNKIPTIIHEQNRVPGKAQKWSLPYASEIAVSFPNTFEGKSEKWVGLPIRSSVLGELEKYPQQEEKLHILVLGGSQGSLWLNELFVDTYGVIQKEFPDKFKVTHLHGMSDDSALRQKYQGFGGEVDLFLFSEDMKSLYSQADIVISRAGANSLFESLSHGCFVFALPYPLADAHQVKNAQYFEGTGRVMTILQNSDSKKNLYNELNKAVKKTDTFKAKEVPGIINDNFQSAHKLVDLAIRTQYGKTRNPERDSFQTS